MTIFLSVSIVSISILLALQMPKNCLDVIYLNGLYVEPSQYVKGLKGIKIYHDCDYFKERHFYHKDARYMDKWLHAIQQEAEYIDVTKKYQRI